LQRRQLRELKECEYVVAFVGVPNSGKTTLFNALTGASELVANWPGATVAIKYARRRIGDLDVCLVDLPGTYSLHGTGAEEKVTREFILSNNVDVMLVVVDSTNIERGLFLALDVLEMHPRTIIALTKIDEAEKRGIRIDVEALSESLGVPVVPVAAIKGIGLDRLRSTIAAVLKGEIPIKPKVGVIVPPELRDAHNRLAGMLKQEGLGSPLAEWLAARLLEDSEWAPKLLRKLLGDRAEKIIREAKHVVETLRQKGVEPISLIAAAKYDYVKHVVAKAVAVEEAAPTVSLEMSRLDKVFLHPLLGPVASLSIMFLVFLVTYAVTTGSPIDLLLDAIGLHRAAQLVEEYSLVNLVAGLMDWIASLVENAIPNPILARLIGEGVLSSSYGVGLVISFMPLVVVMMAIIAALEDSGLVPRIAAGMDRFFRHFGVSGKAIFPVMLSLGCNVPGVLATRIMDSEGERKALAFAVPLIPCMARLTVLLAFAHIYFHGGLASSAAVFTVYLIAIAAFLFTLKLLRRRHVEEEEEGLEFMLELPPVKKPSLRVIWWLTWDKIKHFLIRAGTIIAIVSVVLWLLANYGPHGYIDGGDAADSYAVIIGRLLAPYISILFGVDSDTAWRLGFGFLGGFVAKEVFLDALASVAPGEGLASYHLTPSQALAIMVAVTLYIPCVATLSAMYSETRDKKLVTLAFLYDFLLASVAAAVVRLIAAPLLG
jgi:ferrous iron transport protein B